MEDLQYVCTFQECGFAISHSEKNKFIWFFTCLFVSLQPKYKNVRIMTAIEMNAELFRAMGVIADDETLMAKVVKYVKKLAAQKMADPTLMTKEEFQAKMERGMEDYRQGKCDSLLPGEDLTTYLRRRGYDI